MIKITPEISIHENEIHMDFIRASGPGGQNVNKVASAVQLRFDVKNSPSIPQPVRDRLIKLSGNRLSSEGILIIMSQKFRTQEKNRQDALGKLIMLIRQATIIPKPRQKTKPSRNSREKVLKSKRIRSNIKKLRKNVSSDSFE